MQEFRDKRMMGHALRRCDLKVKVKWKRISKKKMQFSGLLFFLSILEVGASAVTVVGLYLSQTKKRLASGSSLIIAIKWCILQVQIKLRVHVLYLIIPISSRLFFSTCCVIHLILFWLKIVYEITFLELIHCGFFPGRTSFLVPLQPESSHVRITPR